MTSTEETKDRALDDATESDHKIGAASASSKAANGDRKKSSGARSGHDDDARDDDDDDDNDNKGASTRRSVGKGLRSDAERARERASAVGATTAAREAGGATFLKNTWTIARRETRSFFDSLVAYVVVGGSMLGLGVYFFLLQQGGFWQVDRASMSRMFEFLPWALSVLVIPLVTMRALAEEKRSGTMELLITMPVRDSEVILGKYFAAVIMCVVLLAASLMYPIAMFVWPWHLGALDWGPVWCGYLGLVFFSLAGVAIGILFSSITESQIIAFFLTAIVMVFLYIIGGVVEALHGWVGDAISFVSFQTRYGNFARGLIDTRAVVYFASIAILCLLGAFRALESRKWK